jgi:hypothetical protein
MNRDATGRYVLVDLTFALLPAVFPKPSLLCGNRQRCPQFQHAVITFGDLHLGALRVEMHASPHLGRQRYDTPRLDAHVSVKCHPSILPSAVSP